MHAHEERGRARRVRERRRRVSGLFVAAAIALGIAGASSPVVAQDALERPLPDYDGRGEEPTTAGDVLIWVPRLVLAPLYITSEAVRYPLGWAVSTAERKDLPDIVVDFFTWERRKAGIFPTFLIDFGLQPSVGLYFFWNDLGVQGHSIRIRGATWGTDWLMVAARDRWDLAGPWAVELEGRGSRRPDYVYAGIGPRTDRSLHGRYGADRLDGTLLVRNDFWRTSRLEMYAGLRSVTYRNDWCCDDPPVTERVQQGVLEAPPGFDRGFDVYRQGVSLAVDSRSGRPSYGTGVASGTGFRVETFAGLAFDYMEPDELRWWEYGGGAGFFYDVGGRNRVIGLSVETAFADPLAALPIPFSELPDAGGDGPLRGFLPGQVIGQSAIAAEIEYRWPAWVFLDATLTASVGNAFGEHLEGFDPELLRFSAGIGMSTVGQRRDRAFELLLAVGTDPFIEGIGVDSVRFVFGTTHGL